MSTRPNLHIVPVGTSILTNYGPQSRKLPSVRELLAFVKKDPRKHSAELNATLHFFIGANPKDYSVHLINSDTDQGRRCADVIAKFLQELGCHVTRGQLSDDIALEQVFADLFSAVHRVAKKSRSKGQSVLVNCTGGFKGMAIAAALAARSLELPAYYSFANMAQPIFLPTGGLTPVQRDQLLRLKDGTKLPTQKIQSLEYAGLVHCQRRADGEISTVKLTPYAKVSIKKA